MTAPTPLPDPKSRNTPATPAENAAQAAAAADRRRLGTTDIWVSTVALGCWPIAGVTSLDVNDADSLATLAACEEAGVNFLDTAYCYGYQGESELLIRQALLGRRERFVIATKGGIHWGPDGKQVRDGRPATLRRECETSLTRLGTDRVELLYLHAPDPAVPIGESAGALAELRQEGKTQSVGLSNATLVQIKEFAAVCPLAAVQPHYNLLQREIEAEIVPWCRENDVSLVIYWPLMKGLLAGKLSREHVFAPGDGRAKYPMYQGEEWQKNQDLLDRLQGLAGELGRTVAQLAVNWVLCQQGITAALCGAKRPGQIRETAGAMGWRLTAAELLQIDEFVRARGPAASRGAV